MALDEIIIAQLAGWQGYLNRSVLRWRAAVEGARDPTYGLDDLFGTVREQFVDNWDTWNRISAYPVANFVPTVWIKGPFGAISGQSGVAFVYDRLTGATFKKTDLTTYNIQAAGAVPNHHDEIPASNYTVSIAGVHDGQVQVTMTNNAPAAGTYRGMVLYQPLGGSGWDPLAQVVVDAT